MGVKNILYYKVLIKTVFNDNSFSLGVNGRFIATRNSETFEHFDFDSLELIRKYYAARLSYLYLTRSTLHSSLTDSINKRIMITDNHYKAVIQRYIVGYQTN